MSSQETKLTTSDAELVERARSGDTGAFGELWRRHYRSAARVARQFTSSIDADDLVSEAFARIYQRVLAGGGPTGAFRPYLYTTVRNLASSWGAASRDVQVDMIEDFEDERIPDDPATWALDRTLTARAFRSLPERWQTVLWYTEVEGMDPHEVAPLMGLTANGVAALSYRAREGLRKAWLQAHVSDAAASGECQWVMARLGDNARDGLGPRDAERLRLHLVDCPRCTIVSEEVDEVGSHLAMVMLPILLGGVVGGTLLSQLAEPGAAVAADFAIPDLPHSVEAVASGGVLAAPIVGGLSLGAASGTGVLVGGFAIVAVIGGSIALGVAPQLPGGADPAPVAAVEQVTEAPTDPLFPDGSAPAVDPGDNGLVTDVLEGDADGILDGVGDTVDSLVDTITGGTPPPGHTAPGGIVGTDISFGLSGSGTPGAHISVQAAGQVYATTTVGPDGRFAVVVTAVPGGLASLDVVQTVDREYLGGLVDGGLLGGLLGTLDGAINALIAPLALDSLPGGISLNLLNQ